jgi:hypothetical protein
VKTKGRRGSHLGIRARSENSEQGDSFSVEGEVKGNDLGKERK